MSTTDHSICVIDDDPAVLRALTRLLRACGYPVRTFLSAQEFLDAGRGDDARIGCLVVDVHMPGMSGFDLQEALHAARRPLPVILITGASDAKLRTRARTSGAAALLEKPFGDDELIDAVRKATSVTRALAEIGTTGTSGTTGT
jgi:FixJ family two-component response regulator